MKFEFHWINEQIRGEELSGNDGRDISDKNLWNGTDRSGQHEHRPDSHSGDIPERELS